MPVEAIVILGAYLLGAIPSGLVVGKVSKGIDVRQYGSGNIGATNALRTLGLRYSLIVFAADFSKGVAAVLLAKYFLHSYSAEVVAALAAIIGHNWSVFIGFRGGKGVSTSTGTLAVMAPLIALSGIALFVIIVAVSRYVSLGSIVTGIAVFIAILATTMLGIEPMEYLYFGIVGLSLLMIRHRDNVLRIYSGTERKIGQREKFEGKV